jgi:uncharacterized membrane protein
MADISTINPQPTDPAPNQQANVAAPVQAEGNINIQIEPTVPVAVGVSTPVVSTAPTTAGSALNSASQTAGAAVDGAKQAAARAQEAANQVGAQAQQVAGQATQAAAQVSAQAQQLAGQAGQTAAAAQSLAKDLFLPKADQPKVAMEDKVAAFFGYMPLVCFLILLLRSKSDYIALHGRQGMVLTGVFFVSIFIIIVPFIGSMLGSLILIAWFIVSIFSAYQALIGNWWKIPVIGDLAAQIPLTLFATVAHEVIPGQMADQSTIEQVGEIKKEEAATIANDQDSAQQAQTPNQPPPAA